MDEKLKTEDLVTNNNLNTEDLLEYTQSQGAFKNELQNTKYLLGSLSNDTSSKAQKYQNNTMQLINDKTSMLYDSKKSLVNEDILPTEDLLRDNYENDFHKSNKSEIGKFSHNLSRANPKDEFDMPYKTSYLLEESDNNSSNKFSKAFEKKSQSDHNLSVSISEERREEETFTVNPRIIKMPLVFPGETIKVKFSVRNVLAENIYIDFSFVMKEKNILKDIYKEIYQYKDIIDSLENSQVTHNCFKASSNSTEEIKSLSVRDFEVELNCPQIKSKKDLFCILQISSNFNDKTTYSFLPILANVEIPKLLCLKELYTESCSFPLIAIKLNTQIKGQKIKIPFRNYSLKDLDIEFYFEKNTNLQNKVFINNQLFEAQFICFPSNIVIPSHTTAYLELVIKVLRIKQDENCNMLKNKNLIRKVLIAKIRNANAFYTFFLESRFN